MPSFFLLFLVRFFLSTPQSSCAAFLSSSLSIFRIFSSIFTVWIIDKRNALDPYRGALVVESALWTPGLFKATMELLDRSRPLTRRPRRHVRKGLNFNPSVAGISAQKIAALAFVALSPVSVSAQNNDQCVSLQGSKVCPAFQSASISRSSGMIQS